MAADSWQRRLAVQLAAQLPEATADAILVLDLAKELVNGFLAGGDPPGGGRLRVVAREVTAFPRPDAS